ncbi:lipase [Microdochium trichocladiopsis]|uniref:Lipase n=1 Tax=Microdochium trichocladiopsis TaxID=1682393 RepID=A0A9P8XRZ3_9PEZI|nr:lipase [Microdochium trichocladiopsis]KAH7014318.1 lipase [Microdochium trichocladiopsis]
MPATSPKPPPFDPELTPFFAAVPPADIPPEAIPELRRIQNEAATLQLALKDQPFHHHERHVDGPHGSVPVSIFVPKSAPSGSTRRPAIFFIHSGGMICGNRFTFVQDSLRWAAVTNALLITVEYRQSPEHPFPVPHDDCWAALKWVSQNASSLGFDPARLLVAGQSAGGNLAATMALRARDEQESAVQLAGLLIDAGMLDDRMTTSSMAEAEMKGTWTRGSNITAWNAYLDGSSTTPSRRGTKNVSQYAAPARATDLSKLPPTFVGVGSAEAFRDENVEFASRMYAAGGVVELHVWPGGYHCFDQLLPNAEVSKRSLAAKTAWVEKLFAQEAAAVQAKL